MNRPVILSELALFDLLSINDYFLIEVDDKTAAKVINRLEAAVNSLAEFTARGSIPKELLALGITQYRQIIVKPYRIIYEQLPEVVIVHAILDGRRDIETLLSQRLVGSGL
jgi:toxin ParE1/3/4